ncbi:MAG: hypothetical protein IT365_00745 [Candidatus Hydrogenedentes bacterium]|nr:hypothetical protein [Candidatus Hydrogenedentota bacterium]
MAVFAMLFTLAAGLGAAEGSTPPEVMIQAAPNLPSLPQATMSVPWSDFKAILEELQRVTQQQVEKKVRPKPPVPWTIAEAHYTAEAPQASSVRVEAKMKVHVYEEEGWTRIPVLGNTVGLASVMLDGTPAFLTGDGTGWLTLLADKPGPHELDLVFFVNSTEAEGVVSFEFPCAETPVTQMTLRVPVKDANVQSPMASNISVTPGEAGLEAELAFKPSNSIAVQYTLPAELPVAPVVIESRIASTAWTLSELTENYVACKTLLRYTILRGEVDRFELRLPKDANLLNVEGQGTAWTQNPGEDGLAVDVKLNHSVADTFDLVVTYEMPYTGAVVSIPDLRTLSVVRESGYIGVAARGNVEVTPGSTVEGLVRVDAAELPAELRALSPKPMLLAFRYSEGARLLALDVRRLEDVPMPDSTIDLATFETVITKEGMAVTRSIFDVRNSVRQFLRVELDPKAEVWSARVGDQVVKPARDGESGAVLVPLYKSVEVDRRLGSFPVELVYMQHVMPPGGFRYDLALTSPATDILMGEVSWAVTFPDGRVLYQSEGDLERIGELRDELLSPRRRNVTTTSRETIRPLREGIERFLITDINNPAASTGSGDARYKGQPLSPEQAGSTPAVSAVAGVLPVRIDLPNIGDAYRFHTVLTPQGKTLMLSMTTYPRWTARTFSVVSSLVVFAMGMLVSLSLARAVAGLAGGQAGGKRALALLVLCVAALVASKQFLGFSMTLAVWGFVVMSVLYLVPLLGRHFADLRATRMSSKIDTVEQES